MIQTPVKSRRLNANRNRNKNYATDKEGGLEPRGYETVKESLIETLWSI